MSNTRCKATTKSGEKCRLDADSTGYCHIHNPERIAQRKAEQIATEEARKKAYAKGTRLREVIRAIISTCRAKGWDATTTSVDEENWRYVTITVERPVRAGYTAELVSGVFDISIDNGVKVAYHKTSFYSYGLQDLHESIMTDLGRLPWLQHQDDQSKPRQTKLPDALPILVRIIKRFHISIRQLTHRHDNRQTLIVTDEYDVQYYLHALLIAYFEDVRPEEYTPSYAGASSRIDFLLKNEKIVIEAKMTNDRLADKQIGEQLIIDIKRYQSHPDCKTLVCIVYDPNHHIKNPIALEKDLSRKHDNLEVHVYIVPQ